MTRPLANAAPVKRGPGRPRKYLGPVNVVNGTTAEELPKRKRGRPPRVNNLPIVRPQTVFAAYTDGRGLNAVSTFTVSDSF